MNGGCVVHLEEAEGLESFGTTEDFAYDPRAFIGSLMTVAA